MNNEELYENALGAITDLFSDKSVTKKECADNLKNLIGEIEVFIDSLGIE